MNHGGQYKTYKSLKINFSSGQLHGHHTLELSVFIKKCTYFQPQLFDSSVNSSQCSKTSPSSSLRGTARQTLTFMYAWRRQSGHLSAKAWMPPFKLQSSTHFPCTMNNDVVVATNSVSKTSVVSPEKY